MGKLMQATGRCGTGGCHAALTGSSSKDTGYLYHLVVSAYSSSGDGAASWHRSVIQITGIFKKG